MSHKLYAPGTRRNPRFWIARGTIAGHRFEVSCGTADEDTARLFAVTFERKLQADLDRRSPRARAIGPFEQWIMDNLYWSEGLVLWRAGGMILRFHSGPQGYRSAQVKFEGEARTVLEHRVVFLLVNGWLPESVDHRNRDRGDNRPSNLLAATPLSQAQNRGKSGGVIEFPSKING